MTLKQKKQQQRKNGCYVMTVGFVAYDIEFLNNLVVFL